MDIENKFVHLKVYISAALHPQQMRCMISSKQYTSQAVMARPSKSGSSPCAISTIGIIIIAAVAGKSHVPSSVRAITSDHFIN